MRKVARARAKRAVADSAAKVKHHRMTPRDQQREPKTAKELLFCERWLLHHDHQRAHLEAGYSHNRGRALALFKVFQKYLERLMKPIEQVVTKRIAYERADILAAIAAVGYANPLDYIEAHALIDPGTGQVQERYRLKPLHRLTREQAAALDSFGMDADGNLFYTLPKAKTRLTALTTLGEQAANFKKAETHNHLHLGENIPLEKIRDLRQRFMTLVGVQATREILGITEEAVDAEAAS